MTNKIQTEAGKRFAATLSSATELRAIYDKALAACMALDALARRSETKKACLIGATFGDSMLFYKIAESLEPFIGESE